MKLLLAGLGLVIGYALGISAARAILSDEMQLGCLPDEWDA